MKSKVKNELVAENQHDNPEGVARNPEKGSIQPSRGSGREEVFDGSEQDEATGRIKIRHMREVRGWAS